MNEDAAATAEGSKGPGSPVTPLHIDTSLHIELQKEEDRARPVRQRLQQYRFKSTSSYAKKEFKMAWLRDLGWLYEQARTAKSQQEMNSRITNRLQHVSQMRPVQRCFNAVNRFLDRNTGDLTPEQWVIRFRAHVGEAIMCGYLEFDRDLTYVFDGTGCVRAKERPVMAENGSIDVTVPRCKPGRVSCTVDRFFRENAESFKKLAGAIEAKAAAAAPEDKPRLKELVGTAEMIRRAERDASHLCDIDHCSKMGDALIAVDGLTHAKVYAANNDKEWGLISEVFEKELINPVRDAAKAKEATAESDD